MTKKEKEKMLSILHRYKWLVNSEWKNNADKEYEFAEIDKLKTRLNYELHGRI